MTPSVIVPGKANVAAQAAFVDFVVSAGQVDAGGLANRVAVALALVTLAEKGELIGSAAIKHRPLEYRQRLFRKAGVEHQAPSCPQELGWVHVHPDHEGGHLSHLLIEAALRFAEAQGGGIYATTLAPAMHHMLPFHYGFAVLGQPYPSDRQKDQNLTLYVRPG